MDNNFSFYTEIEIRISDINYGGHLGNDRYLSLFHDARIRYLNQFGYSEYDIGNNIGIIMAESHINYKAEAFLGDILDIGVRINEIGKVKFLMEYIIIRLSDNKTIATGYTKMGSFNYKSKKTAKIPQEFKEKLCLLKI